MTEKTCTVCGHVKPVDDFCRRHSGTDKRRNECKACKSEASRARTAANVQRRQLAAPTIGSTKTCNRCGYCKQFGQFYRDVSSRDGRCSICKSCRNETDRLSRSIRGKRKASEIDTSGTKRCGKCGGIFDKSGFHKNRTTRDGLQYEPRSPHFIPAILGLPPFNSLLICGGNSVMCATGRDVKHVIMLSQGVGPTTTMNALRARRNSSRAWSAANATQHYSNSTTSAGPKSTPLQKWFTAPTRSLRPRSPRRNFVVSLAIARNPHWSAGGGRLARCRLKGRGGSTTRSRPSRSVRCAASPLNPIVPKSWPSSISTMSIQARSALMFLKASHGIRRKG